MAGRLQNVRIEAADALLDFDENFPVGEAADIRAAKLNTQVIGDGFSQTDVGRAGEELVILLGGSHKLGIVGKLRNLFKKFAARLKGPIKAKTYFFLRVGFSLVGARGASSSPSSASCIAMLVAVCRLSLAMRCVKAIESLPYGE